LKSDYNWIRTIMNKGTVADRVAANTIAIQDSPIHTLSLLQNLVSMVKVIKKKECTMVLGEKRLVLGHKANSALSKCMI
jgi:ribosome biogenesis protein MAK21